MKLFSPRLWVLALAAIGLTLTAQPAKAEFKVSFGSPSPNSVGDANIAEAQIYAEVFDRSEGGVDKVGIRFHNTGPLQSTITNIAFEDGTLLAQLNIVLSNPGGMAFSETTNKNSLNPFPFLTDGARNFFENTAGSPAPDNGVNPGEWAEFVFSLQDGKTYDDVLQALTDGFDGPDLIDPNDEDSGLSSLRLAIHVQNFASGGSEKLVGDSGGGGGGGNAVPAPAGLILLASAVPVLAFRRLIRRKPVAA